MAKEYKKENIINTYFTIAILDDCFKIHGEIYDEIDKSHTPQNLIVRNNEDWKRIYKERKHEL